MMIDVKLETPGLEMSDPILSKDNIYVTINGTDYVYKMKDGSELTPNEVVKKVLGIKKFSDGKALSFLKKNCDGVRVKKEGMDDNFYTIPKHVPELDTAVKNEVTEGMIDIVDNILKSLDYQDERERYKIIFDVMSEPEAGRLKDKMIEFLMDKLS